MLELAHSFATTQVRRELTRGLLDLRRALAAVGINVGVQWVDGSFCEAVEQLRNRPPDDIDVVTLFPRPPAHHTDAAIKTLLDANPNLFQAVQAKAAFRCDAYYVDVSRPASMVLRQITYWFGLLSHQRETQLWKGMLEIPIDPAADQQAADFLNSLGARS